MDSDTASFPPIRIGVLGCGSVVDYAILQPARDEAAITVAAVASRDLDKAREFAARHGIARAHGSYRALLEDREIDAVYVALPNALHHRWSIAALEAGYAVLCEKPLAANADEASEMAETAERTGRLLVEAFHWRWHPVAARLEEILDSGTIGALEQVETFFHIPAFYLDADNIRLDPALAGGSMMDQGCYLVSLLRLLGLGEPSVTAAEADCLTPGIDGAMRVALRFGNGVEASLACSMNGRGEAIRCGAILSGAAGRLTLDNPFMPGWGSRIILDRDGAESVEIPSRVPSYTWQARAFAALLRDPPAVSPAWDGVRNMQVIDAAYRAAGLASRG